MRARQELKRHIIQASQVEKLDFLPPSPSFFQRKLAEVVTDILRDEMSSFSLGLQAACKETINRMLPLADFLTQPRSTAEFQDLKRGLLEIFWQYDRNLRFIRGEVFENEEQKQTSGVVDWLHYLLPELGIFPNSMELDFWGGERNVDEVWQIYEKLEPRPPRRAEDKIVSFEQAVGLARAVHQKFEGRVGYVGGKWRLGPHPEHIGLLQTAKEVLGRDGLLIVGVESQRSIWQRRGESHVALADEVRLRQMAALEAVDCAFLLSPSSKKLEDLNGFYYRVWRELGIDFYFFGSADYHWREEFERRARDLGVILLWERPKAHISTSEIIEQIRKAS